MKNVKIMIMAVLMTVTAFGVRAQKWGATPEDSVRNITNYSLYTESYKQKNYIDAYTPWKALIHDLPDRHKNDYIQGANILKHNINAAKTPAKRDSLISELMSLYDQRSKYFGEKATNLARKAYDLEMYKKKAALKEYYGYYSAAIAEDPMSLDGSYVYKYFDATVDYVLAGYGDSTLVVDNYDIASDLLDAELKREIEKEQAGKKNKAEDFRKYISNVEAAFSPFASCEQLVKIYSSKFEKNPEDIDLLKKMTNILMKKGCTEEPLFFEATEKLYSLEPSPVTAMRMGQMCISNEKWSDAVRYLSDAAKEMTEEKDQYKAHILLGLAYGGQGSYTAARNSFYEAARIDPTTGEPYLQIAQLYARGSHSVPDGMHGQSAYWAAVDKAVRARNIDQSEANVEAANKIISLFSSYFPKKDKAFELDLIDGASYTVPGWIGETTTVRTRR